MPKFKENVTPSQRKELHCLASKEQWLTINQAPGSDVILMLCAVMSLIKYLIIIMLLDYLCHRTAPVKEANSN